METNTKILMFKLPDCDPCAQLTSWIETEAKEVVDLITQYTTPDDLPMFKAKRVSGAPQIIVMQGEIELHRAKGFDGCVDLIKRIIEDDY